MNLTDAGTRASEGHGTDRREQVPNAPSWADWDATADQNDPNRPPRAVIDAGAAVEMTAEDYAEMVRLRREEAESHQAFGRMLLESFAANQKRRDDEKSKREAEVAERERIATEQDKAEAPLRQARQMAEEAAKEDVVAEAAVREVANDAAIAGKALTDLTQDELDARIEAVKGRLKTNANPHAVQPRFED